MNRPALLRGGALALATGAGVLFAVVSGGLLGDRTRPRSASDEAAPEASWERVADAGPEAAVRMVDRLQLFRTGNLGRRMTLGSEELTAVLRHAAPGLLPEGVRDPEVRLVGSEIRIRARVSPALLPGGGHLGAARTAVPDDIDVELRGRLRPQGTGAVAYRIERAEVEGIPLPTSLLVRLVRAWPGGTIEGPAHDQRALVLVRWPFPSTRVRVTGDELVLERHEPILAESVDGIDGA